MPSREATPTAATIPMTDIVFDKGAEHVLGLRILVEHLMNS